MYTRAHNNKRTHNNKYPNYWSPMSLDCDTNRYVHAAANVPATRLSLDNPSDRHKAGTTNVLAICHV